VKRPTESTRIRRAPDAGFTLLEVLAAVAILGIWYSVLASVAIQGLRAEGENARRIRAALLADRTLADVELELDARTFTFEILDPLEEEEFTISVETIPLIETEFQELDPTLLALFEGDLSSLVSSLYTIEVRVVWIEGAHEEAVTRITYARDPSAIDQLLGPEPGVDAGQDPDAGARDPQTPVVDPRTIGELP
jgi:prepilin-type N-terminal cleavage/methylation domain-containing protein